MMVERRLKNNESEDADMYHLLSHHQGTDNSTSDEEERGSALEDFTAFARGFTPQTRDLQYQMQKAKERWTTLNSDARHVRLQRCIMNHIGKSWLKHKKKS
ncbi:hypothetical protein SEMRO_3704_G350520.1 [Seminavis robusta]|uniref:Uncharacterized protein n=1 Tax=Seminavis robusta TaxID=568900 RepID=A0A9N8F5X5_9STRA|nr:hypothetical protein SEMRO_3704_G350520.1 [Seminavis robusta]|eukprot:Sro3704_g350520.1 n/a (101) ;mRNA; f:2296-2598